MKGLKRTGIIIGGLIIISFVASIVMTHGLNDRVATAHKRGENDGYARGQAVGYQEGSTIGHQAGSKIGYQEGNKIGYPAGREEGYNSGSKAGFEEAVSTGYLVRNPNYNEVQEMLARKNVTSAWEINNNAEAKGIRAAYVQVHIATGGYYTIIGFEAVDNGLIFIDPERHKEVKLEIGKRYSELNSYPPPSYDDTITGITIIW